MPKPPPTPFARIFKAMMLFCGLVWLWTVALMIGWPWQKDGTWQPEFRLVALCGEPAAACALPYGELAAAKADGRLHTLDVPAAGELALADSWLKWSRQGDIVETKASSWQFQTTVRYRLDGERPVLVAYRTITAKAFYLGLAGGLFTLVGIYLRKLRR